MNFLFLSPHFPPQYVHFAAALRDAGVRVLGVGDTPHETLPHELRAQLAEYYFAPNMHDLDAMIRAVGYLTWRYGRMDRIESLNEHWLQLDADLRGAFGVFGMTSEETARHRSKFTLCKTLTAAGIPTIPTARVPDAVAVKAFAREHGYPLVLKPEVGVGAVGAFKVSSDAEVDRELQPGRPDHVAQPFIQGSIVTWDGLVDRDGQLVFRMSHEYSDGVMETVNENRHIAFWNVREVPQRLDRLGHEVISALGLRERWFHLEFFRTAPDRYVVLEANLRPPGGFITDMMNYACDMDVYRIYAAVVAGRDWRPLVHPPRYHVSHVGRKVRSYPYRHGRAEVMQRLGDKLLWARDLPSLFAAAMGDEMYLTRHESFEELRRDVAFIQER